MLDSRLDTKKTRLIAAKRLHWLFCSEQRNNSTTLVSSREARYEESRLWVAWRSAAVYTKYRIGWQGGRELAFQHREKGAMWTGQWTGRERTTATLLDLYSSEEENSQSGILEIKYLKTKLATSKYLVYCLAILWFKHVQTQLPRWCWRQAETWVGGAIQGSLLL